MTKVLTIYGECDEREDPTVYEKAIRDGFDWLVKNGYRSVAVDLLDEMSVAIQLVEHLVGRKSAFAAKRDGDWEWAIDGIKHCKTPTELITWQINNKARIRTFPLVWREPLQDEFDRHMANLRGDHNAEC